MKFNYSLKTQIIFYVIFLRTKGYEHLMNDDRVDYGLGLLGASDDLDYMITEHQGLNPYFTTVIPFYDKIKE